METCALSVIVSTFLFFRFLAEGETFRSFNFLNGRSTACDIVSSVRQVLWDVLGHVYVARPSSKGEWPQVNVM